MVIEEDWESSFQGIIDSSVYYALLIVQLELENLDLGTLCHLFV